MVTTAGLKGLQKEQKCTFKNRTYEMLKGTAVQIDYKRWRL